MSLTKSILSVITGLILIVFFSALTLVFLASIFGIMFIDLPFMGILLGGALVVAPFMED
tara:strand:+ start:869 stop:1045 length:177 start_codon:yes stop_codon:yes gene_type:complete